MQCRKAGSLDASDHEMGTLVCELTEEERRVEKGLWITETRKGGSIEEDDSVSFVISVPP